MSTGSCGCCSGIAHRTPLGVANRPGLSAVAYRVGTHADVLASMIADLGRAGRADPGPASGPGPGPGPDPASAGGPLAALTTRDPDDLGIALLDAWAAVADVLTFHSERLVQESWLRTAVDRRSLQELGRLVGHRMAPGVAAETHLAFAVEPAPPVPETAGRDPGVAPPVTPAWVRIPPGVRVQSIPGPGEQPQTFETVAPVTARPGHNAMPAARTVRHVPTTGDTTAWLAGVASNLAVGDLLLLVGEDVVGDRWDVRELTTVQVDAGNDRTRVTWDRPLGSIDPVKAAATDPEAFVLRRRLNVFGHNAPGWNAMSRTFRAGYVTSSTTHSDWPSFTLSPAAGQVVDIDGSQPQITVGSWLVLAQPNYRELYRVAAVTELSRAQFAISGKVTRVTLDVGENFALFDGPGKPRQVSVWAVSEPLELTGAPDTSVVEGDRIVVDADLGELEVGAPVIVAGRSTAGHDHAEVAVVAATHPTTDPGRWRLDLERGLGTAYERASVVVHGNVAAATHGETVTEVLGSGHGAATFQRFALSHGPLTHVQAATGTGTASTLVVRVNDVAWDEVRSHHGAGPRDHSFTTAVDEHGTRVVAFGDGRRGARLPSGANNVRARYRKGLGTEGNVGPGALAQLLDRPLGVRGVGNPLPASGGTDPETAEEARETIPRAVRTLGRAVSLLDYEDLALAFPGIAKAGAAVLPLAQGRTIVLTVAFAPGTGDDATARLETLTRLLRSQGDPQVQVAVLEAATQRVRLGLRVSLAPAHDGAVVLAALDTALRTAFGFPARRLLEPVHASEVVAVAHGVAGVDGVLLERLHLDGQAVTRAERLLAPQPAVVAGQPRPAGLLLLADGPLDVLEVRP